MVKDDKINIKLEVFKDKNSGKLLLMAHFDQNAPNVFKEKENILWMPTVEEKDFLNEAFKMIPGESTFSPSKEAISKPEELKEILSKPEELKEILSKPEELKEIVSELEESKEIVSELEELKEIVSEPEEPKEIKGSSELQSPHKEPKRADISPVEKSEDSSVFVESNEDIQTDDISKNIESEDIPPDIDEPTTEEPKADELKTLEKDKAIIVEADAEAIDEALKKRTKKDESIIEADEQTIIDKVLSQKKKGRWSGK